MARKKRVAASGEWSRGDLEEILRCEKNAHGYAASWSDARLPSGRLFCAELAFLVTVRGHDLLVRARWKGDQDQQVFIQWPHASWNLTRLCIARVHSAEPHWHDFEGYGGLDVVHDDPEAPSGPEDMDDLLAHFIARQRITGITIDRRLFER